MKKIIKDNITHIIFDEIPLDYKYAQELKEYLFNTDEKFVLDLTNASYVNSSGLGVIVKSAKDNRLIKLIYKDVGSVDKIMKITNLEDKLIEDKVIIEKVY